MLSIACDVLREQSKNLTVCSRFQKPFKNRSKIVSKSDDSVSELFWKRFFLLLLWVSLYQKHPDKRLVFSLIMAVVVVAHISRYYVGGRGRKRWSDESPVTPLQDVSGEDGSLKDRLGCLATKLQGHIQDIAERERCSLGSLELEMHGGEVKVST